MYAKRGSQTASPSWADAGKTRSKQTPRRSRGSNVTPQQPFRPSWGAGGQYRHFRWPGSGHPKNFKIEAPNGPFSNPTPPAVRWERSDGPRRPTAALEGTRLGRLIRCPSPRAHYKIRPLSGHSLISSTTPPLLPSPLLLIWTADSLLWGKMRRNPCAIVPCCLRLIYVRFWVLFRVPVGDLCLVVADLGTFLGFVLWGLNFGARFGWMLRFASLLVRLCFCLDLHRSKFCFAVWLSDRESSIAVSGL
jgi:hypothetical protein